METGSGKVFKNPKKFEPSTGEKDLEREVKTIKVKRYQLQQEQDKLATTTFAWERYKEQPAPLASKVKTNSQNFGLCPENRVSEWEKNEIKKLFWNYDKDKSGYLDFDEMSQVLRDIKENKAGIGKVPVDDVPSIIEVMRAWDRNNDAKIQWREFRDGMNTFRWKLCDEDFLKQEIKNLYAKAKKEEMNGRNDSAKQLAMMAMRLEGLDTRTKPLIKESEPLELVKFRTDTFFVYRFKEAFRDVGVKTIYNSSKPLDLSPHMVVLR
jgi:Ca2+-binding EF-hand superfamily protein